jgi:hypothetical protein
MEIYARLEANDGSVEHSGRSVEATLSASPSELRLLSAFLASCADEMEALGAKYSHVHFDSRQGRSVKAPHLTVYRSDE